LRLFGESRALIVVDPLREQFLQLIDQQHQGWPQRLIGVAFAPRSLGHALERAYHRPRRGAATPEMIGERDGCRKIALCKFR
jgi:hypothetical protein